MSVLTAALVELVTENRAATVARATPVWQAWFQQRFPMPAESSKSGGLT